MQSRVSVPYSHQRSDTHLLDLFERGQLNFNGMFDQEVMTYESNIAYTLRFMIDTKVRDPPGELKA